MARPKKSSETARLQGTAQRERAPFSFPGFVHSVVLWLVPVTILWWLLTPYYNRFLTIATENLVRLFERPPVTELVHTEDHYFLIDREGFDGPARGGAAGSVRVTDTHFPVLFLAALFLAVPGSSMRSRLAALGQASLVLVFFHLLSLVFWVEFVYATQLGSFSVEHYTTLSRNFWGLGKHLLDLPFKFAMPLMLWSAFHLHRLLPPSGPAQKQ